MDTPPNAMDAPDLMPEWLPGRTAKSAEQKMYEAMRKTQEGREWMGRADEKINDYMEEKEKEREEREKERARSQEGSPEETRGPVTRTDDEANGPTDAHDDVAPDPNTHRDAAASEQKRETRLRDEESDVNRHGKKSKQEQPQTTSEKIRNRGC